VGALKRRRANEDNSCDKNSLHVISPLRHFVRLPVCSAGEPSSPKHSFLANDGEGAKKKPLFRSFSKKKL
jgi:hypothetical protein